MAARGKHMTSAGRRFLPSLALGLSLVAPGMAAAAPACAPPLGGGGTPVAYPQPLSEPARRSLSEAIAAALKDPEGGGSWPRAAIAAAPACEVARFDADGAGWVVSGGLGRAPPRWAQTAG